MLCQCSKKYLCTSSSPLGTWGSSMDTCQTREFLSQFDFAVSWSCALGKICGSIRYKGNNTTYACHISFMTWLQGMTSPHEKHSTGGTCRRRSSSTLCWELGEASRFGGQFFGTTKMEPTPNLISPPKKVAKRSWHLQVGTDLMWITDGSLSGMKREQDKAKPHVNQKHSIASSCTLVKGDSCCDAMEA